jgi:hypothetical protein
MNLCARAEESRIPFNTRATKALQRWAKGRKESGMAAEAASDGGASGRRMTLSTDDYERVLDRLRHALQYAEATRATIEEALRLLEAGRENQGE